MSRWPAFARCKRRLGATVGPRAAAAVQARLRWHTLAVATSLADEGILDLQLAVSGSGINPHRSLNHQNHYQHHSQQNLHRHRQPRRQDQKLRLQGEGRLGLRMRRQLLQARRGRLSPPLLIIGTDLPDLCRRDLCCAIDALTRHDLVVGPARDGGYWLLGLGPALAGECPSWLFAGLPWGSDRVLAITRERAIRRGLMPFLLREHNDIDRVEDLKPWQA